MKITIFGPLIPARSLTLDYGPECPSGTSVAQHIVAHAALPYDTAPVHFSVDGLSAIVLNPTDQIVLTVRLSEPLDPK